MYVQKFCLCGHMLRELLSRPSLSTCVHQATFVSFLHAFITQTCAGTYCQNMQSYEYIFKININDLLNVPQKI